MRQTKQRDQNGQQQQQNNLHIFNFDNHQANFFSILCCVVVVVSSLVNCSKKKAKFFSFHSTLKPYDNQGFILSLHSILSFNHSMGICLPENKKKFLLIRMNNKILLHKQNEIFFLVFNQFTFKLESRKKKIFTVTKKKILFNQVKCLSLSFVGHEY